MALSRRAKSCALAIQQQRRILRRIFFAVASDRAKLLSRPISTAKRPAGRRSRHSRWAARSRFVPVPVCSGSADNPVRYKRSAPAAAPWCDAGTSGCGAGCWPQWWSRPAWSIFPRSVGQQPLRRQVSCPSLMPLLRARFRTLCLNQRDRIGKVSEATNCWLHLLAASPPIDRGRLGEETPQDVINQRAIWRRKCR